MLDEKHQALMTSQKNNHYLLRHLARKFITTYLVLIQIVLQYQISTLCMSKIKLVHDVEKKNFNIVI
jgi:ABC-type enterobactin transport system permease subunit